MQFNRHNTRKLLREFKFQTLFTEELGWEHLNEEVKAEIRESEADYGEYQLTAVAEKHGMAAFHCTGRTDGSMPDGSARRKIQRRVAKAVHEHLIIYTDAEKTAQIWQSVKREPGKPLACREHRYDSDQSGEALVQKLEGIAFSLEEEEDLTLVDVTGRVRAAFDVERVTKKFYEHFKVEHSEFLKFLNGIPDGEMERWYASVMLNRLMFIYFIQKKGFLDNDPTYLQKKLAERKADGADLYYTNFLCPLFFEGFAKPEPDRSAEAKRLIGTVPYLNGGIFQRHQIEELHGEKIQIADAAFDGLFKFFEGYQWHLDDRPLKNDNEINPDVLGYIFEKYINQKQMGAYYTKEDITEYISKNTIVPFLLDTARENCRIAFTPPVKSDADSGTSATVWQLLVDDPNRYIYDAVKKGVKFSLPPEIAAGLDDVSARTDWNTPAPDEFALPTELWREVVARRARYNEIHVKLSNAEIHDVNDLITFNLNIRQFAQDIIDNCEGPELLRAFWRAITQVTVLDPTCGSGAFLFAALNILEPLYEACLDRMQVFLDESPNTGDSLHAKKYPDFREILSGVDKHPNRKYFILKSIIINNLYGVDIMEEAVEICKLRLFLKMVAQIEDIDEIEPLPDIDFNIQAGNTLVGYATYDEVERAVTENRIDFDNTMTRIKASADDIESLFEQFRRQQTELGGARTPVDKQRLLGELNKLKDELNRYLAEEYLTHIKRGGGADRESVQRWVASHRPFHWFIEFYGIISNGGFDVIIGNPPYVEYNKVKKEYAVRGYETEICGNLYAFTCERSLALLSASGVLGLIVPLSLMSTTRMARLQNVLYDIAPIIWLSSFDVYPAKLFEGAKQRLSIIIASLKRDQETILTTHYNRWKPQERGFLFSHISYLESFRNKAQGVIPKLGNTTASSVLNKVSQKVPALFSKPRSLPSFYVHQIPYNFVKAFDFIPYFWNEVDGQKKSTDYKPYFLNSTADAEVMLAVLNSNLFFWWWYLLFDGYHCVKYAICSFPSGLREMREIVRQRLKRLAADLMQDYKRHSGRRESFYKTTGRVIYEEFYPRYSKPIIDDIDRVLAQHYGFTDEELDFIINYDIKYRMGLGSGA